VHGDLRVVCFGPFRFDLANGLVFNSGQQAPLPHRALGVLAVLACAAGKWSVRRSFSRRCGGA
jgi:DNA-binding response OmpR family regulator